VFQREIIGSNKTKKKAAFLMRYPYIVLFERIFQENDKARLINCDGIKNMNQDNVQEQAFSASTPLLKST